MKIRRKKNRNLDEAYVEYQRAQIAMDEYDAYEKIAWDSQRNPFESWDYYLHTLPERTVITQRFVNARKNYFDMKGKRETL
jgi:hypothetical protein